MNRWHVSLEFYAQVEAANTSEAIAAAKQTLGLAPMDNRPDQHLTSATASVIDSWDSHPHRTDHQPEGTPYTAEETQRWKDTAQDADRIC